MNIALIFLIMGAASAGGREDFFPKHKDGYLIEDRFFDKEKIQRGQEQIRDTYRYVVNYKNLQRMPMEIAHPILQLSQYSWCNIFPAAAPLQVNLHFEPTHVETDFKCVTPPDYDPAEFRKKMQSDYCADSKIRSRTQEIICKELLLR